LTPLLTPLNPRETLPLMLTLKIGFEKLGKNTDFRNSQNNWEKTAEDKLDFFTFSELLGPKEKREG
jgi:hypothetical protein